MSEERFRVLPALRTGAALMIGLTGPSGSGKTWSALRLAKGIRSVVPKRPIILIDTENKRARHYAEDFDFLHVDFAAPFGSLEYVTALRTAASLRPAVVILDSLSHEHDGEGGHLDSYAGELERLTGGDPTLQQRFQLTAWRRPKSERRVLLAELVRSNVHIIACFRAAERSRPAKEGAEILEMGFTPVGAPEFVYEMTLAALLRPGARGVPTWRSNLPGEAMAIKRPHPFEKLFRDGTQLNEHHGRILALWAKGPASARRRRAQPVRRPSAAGPTIRSPSKNGAGLNGVDQATP